LFFLQNFGIWINECLKSISKCYGISKLLAVNSFFLNFGKPFYPLKNLLNALSRCPIEAIND
jgi:hypothetical protein